MAERDDILARYRREDYQPWGGLKSYLPEQAPWLKAAQSYLGSALMAANEFSPEAMAVAGFLGPKARLPPMKDYRSKWRLDHGAKPSTYDPEFFSTQPEILRSETGAPVAYKSQLVPRREIADDSVIAHRPDLIHRGISAAEYESILESGMLQSKGAYNIGDSQKGLTYFTTDPASAVSYASSFAPTRFKPSPGRDAYVVSARRPDDSRIRAVDGTASHEVGVMGAIPASDIEAIYRGRVVAHTPEYRSKGFRSAPTSRLHWEPVNDLPSLLRRYYGSE